MNKKARVELDKLIKGVVAVVVLAIVFVGGVYFLLGGSMERFLIYIPWYNATQPPVPDDTILGYHIDEDAVKYHDGNKWLDLKRKGKILIKETQFVNDKFVYDDFHSYYVLSKEPYRPSPIIQPPQGYLGEIEIKGLRSEFHFPTNNNGGDIFVDANVRKLEGNEEFRVSGDVGTDPINFRFSNEKWEWKALLKDYNNQHPEEINWQPIDETVLGANYFNLNYFTFGINEVNAKKERMKILIRRLIGKNLASGKEILKQTPINGEVYILNYPTINIPGGPSRYRDSDSNSKTITENAVYLKYLGTRWVWSHIPKSEWTNLIGWQPGPYYETIKWNSINNLPGSGELKEEIKYNGETWTIKVETLLTNTLRRLKGKTSEAGKEIIIQDPEITYHGSNIEGRFFVSLSGKVEFLEKTSSGFKQKEENGIMVDEVIWVNENTKTQGVSLQPLATYIREKAWRWKDSIMKNPIQLSHFQKGEPTTGRPEYKAFCPIQIDPWTIGIDPSKPVSQEATCQT